MSKAAAIYGAMQATLDTGKTMSENVVSAEIDEEVASMRVRLPETEVSGKVVLGSISPSRVEMQTKIPMRNPDGVRFLAPLD